jgi:hypothetical protein
MIRSHYADIQGSRPPSRIRGNAGLIAALIVAGAAALGLGVWIPSVALRESTTALRPVATISRAQLEAMQRARLCRGAAPQTTSAAERKSEQPR